MFKRSSLRLVLNCEEFIVLVRGGRVGDLTRVRRMGYDCPYVGCA